MSVYIFLTAIPARKSGPASVAHGPSDGPGPSGAEGFTRVGPPPHPSLSGSPGTDDNHKLGEQHRTSFQVCPE